MDVATAAEHLRPLGSSASPSWVLLGVAAMAVVYLLIRPRKRDPLAKSPARLSIGQQKSLERDMQHVIVELSEFARQMSAQLETRAAKLELLIRDADERVATLNAAVDAAKSRPAAATLPMLTLASANDSGEAMPAIVPAPAQPVRGMRLADHSVDRWNDVYAHADQGLNAREIARAMNRPQGEIELILALRPKPRHAANEPAVAVG